MAFKPKPEEVKKGAPEYMNTYGDMITLMLTFFVLLYAMSTLDVDKFKALAESYSGRPVILTGGVGNAMPETGDGLLPEMIAPEEVPSDTPSDQGEAESSATAEDKIIADSARAKGEELSQMASDFKTYFATEETTSGIQIDVSAEYVNITFSDGMLFDSGSADLKPGSLEMLDMLAVELLKYPNNRIEVEGHTDNWPMTSNRYPSNRHLSSARADTVVEYLTNNHGLNPLMVESAGKSEYWPIAENDTPEGRAKNRRVEIKIYSNITEAISYADSGFITY